MGFYARVRSISGWLPLTLPVLTGVLLLIGFVSLVQGGLGKAHADPIDPPEGYPKFNTSIKTVTPTLAHIGGEKLTYKIEIRNTGAYTGFNTTFKDVLPAGLKYNGDAWSSVPPAPTFSKGILRWSGDVGFDETVVITFSTKIKPDFSGIVRNTAEIKHRLLDEPVEVSAETIVSDDPILTIEKTSEPGLPGANKPLTYTIVVRNEGQPAVNLPITVTERIPKNTSLPQSSKRVITWKDNVTLDTGESTAYTFKVDVGDVPSGTVITNDNYQVEALGNVVVGEAYTVTVVDPQLWLVKELWPNPPGSSREMTYTLTVLNLGSPATSLVITDRVPAGVTYVRGGTKTGRIVSWELPKLDTDESAQFDFTVYVGDVMDVEIVNNAYGVCSAEGICASGLLLATIVQGPTFEASAELDPIAKKPGGGTGPVTPTLVVRNLGPGNAFDANVLLRFERISVGLTAISVDPAGGTLTDLGKCGSKCVDFGWQGDLFHGEAITFTAAGESTKGGQEGTHYTATLVVTDTLTNMTTEPVTATAIGTITHLPNLNPTKTAPAVIGSNMLLTYTIAIWNSGLSTGDESHPLLTDTVPVGTKLVRVNNGGKSKIIKGKTVVSWALPDMSPGDTLIRSFVVRVNEGLISGTQIVNDNYRASWNDPQNDAVLSNLGPPVTTTVQEVGLIDSYKEVSPALVIPGPGNVLTYQLHIVNSGPKSLTGVKVVDLLPWQASTYMRDAVASAGQIIGDIVSIHWRGNVAPFSSETITFTVLVDADFQGVITNTAIIKHPSLSTNLTISTLAYVTDEPILQISKQASPDPVSVGKELQYTIHLKNLGQRATGLVIMDTIPKNTTYVPGSAEPVGQLVGGQFRWQWPVLEPNEGKEFTFRVTVNGGSRIVNDTYGATSAQGVTVWGSPVVTKVRQKGGVYLPLAIK